MRNSIMTIRTLRQAKEMCQAVCGHLPLPGHRVMISSELGPELGPDDPGGFRVFLGGAVYRRRLSGTWLANQSPSGTPASSSDYRVILLRHDTAIRDFEICPLCSRGMSYHGIGRLSAVVTHRMGCASCNRLFPLDERNAPLVIGDDITESLEGAAE